MVTIKSYTDLEQSKKLAEILPLKSADMMYHSVEDEYGSGVFVATSKIITNGFKNDDFYIDDIPCWSVAALLNVLPKYELNNFGDTIQLDVNLETLATEGDETLLDLVVNMIIHLHELNLL